MALCALLVACSVGGDTIEIPPLDPGLIADDSPFYCESLSSVRCEANVHLSCYPIDEFYEVEEVDCADMGLMCDPERVCITCHPKMPRCQPCEPGDVECDPQVAQVCNDDGDAWEDVERCDVEAGFGCFDGECESMCDRARFDRSYVGCEFFAVDLDNAAIDDSKNAAAQQFSVAVANPQDTPVDVTVSVNDAPFGQEPDTRIVAEVTVPPGSLEVFKLDQREVDGSTPGALNDGTHTAVTSNAFRIDSSHPIIAYQFNPLENVNVFSNDASLLLPISALGTDYSVVSWPQTIGNSEDPSQDFDSTSDEEDLRAFLTIVGTEADTQLEITLGKSALRIVGAGPIAASGPGDVIELDIGPYDVVNLETEGLNVDFTGSIVKADKPVLVFVGSEASDVPRFGTYSTRQCCADHLEEQLFPDTALGTFFSIARMPPRTAALAAAAREGERIDVAITDEPEWVRVLAVLPGTTNLYTTLPSPQDVVPLEQGEDVTLRADQDFILESSQAVAVLQALPSQGVTGIPSEYPGGDPSIIAVPPVQQYRSDYIFLTPDKYAFDFVVITAEAAARVSLDGEELDPDDLDERCTMGAADGIDRDPEDVPADRVVYRCQLSFPKIVASSGKIEPGQQNDGVHTVASDREVGIVVYGFDLFVSYAYAGGLDLDVLQ
jgi:hypothetical protein